MDQVSDTARTRLARLAVLALIGCALLLLVAASSARAVDSAIVGQYGDNSTEAPCPSCTAFQFFEAAGTPTSYRFPFTGIVTQFSLRVGADPQTAESITLRTFRQGSGNHATVVSEGSTQTIPVSSAGNVATFLDRIPASANDILGGKWTGSAYFQNTDYRFLVSNPGDQVSSDPVNPVNVGVDHDYGASSSPLKINMQALLEPDADGDQYGDESQDLCPNDATKAQAPCSGALVGSPMSPVLPGNFTIDAGFARTFVQRTVGGVSTRALSDGVIVRWRVRPGSNLTTRIRVLRETAGQYVIDRSSGLVAIPFDPARRSKVITVPARLPISAGDYVGIDKPVGAALSTYSFGAGNALFRVLSDPDGSTVTELGGGATAHELGYSVDIEPDADHDGFGDLTQDPCPTDAAVQVACALPADTAAPIITQFKTLYKRFRWKPKGAVVSKRAHAGTTISLNLSEPANVKFTVTKAFRGKITKGKCKKAGRSNRKNRRCTKYILVHSFARSLNTGVNAFPYSARYLDAKGKIGTLRFGPYRMTAVATDPSGNTGPEKTIAFKVRR